MEKIQKQELSVHASGVVAQAAPIPRWSFSIRHGEERSNVAVQFFLLWIASPSEACADPKIYFKQPIAFNLLCFYWLPQHVVAAKNTAPYLSKVKARQAPFENGADVF